nr:MAG TPA: hypothetical protein [Caudoviricetes sp.]
MGVFDGYSIVALDFPEAFDDFLASSYQYIFSWTPIFSIVGHNYMICADMEASAPTLKNILNPYDPSHLPEYRFIHPVYTPNKYIKSRIYSILNSVDYSIISGEVAGIIYRNNVYKIWLSSSRKVYNLDLTEPIIDFFQIGLSRTDLKYSFVLTESTLYVYNPISKEQSTSIKPITSYVMTGGKVLAGCAYNKSGTKYGASVMTKSSLYIFTIDSASGGITLEKEEPIGENVNQVVFDSNQTNLLSLALDAIYPNIRAFFFSDDSLLGEVSFEKGRVFALGNLSNDFRDENSPSSNYLFYKSNDDGKCYACCFGFSETFDIVGIGTFIPTYNLTSNKSDDVLFNSFTSQMQLLDKGESNSETYAWLDENGVLYVLTKDIIKTLTTTLSYCTNDTTSPHTYTDLYPNIRLESIIDYESAGAEFQVYTTSSSAKAVRASDGKTLTASPVNGIATIGNVGYGTWTVTAGSNTKTIEVREFKQYKVFATLNDYSWAEISAVSQSGDAKNLFSVGDCKAVTLNGSVGAYNFSNYTSYMFIVDFDHNSDKEMNGEHDILFSFGKSALTDGKDIAFVDSLYNGYTSNPCYHMNSSNTNSGGWASSYMRQTICSQFKNAMPSDLQAVLRTRTIYTDNTGGGSDSSSYVTATTDTVYIPSEFEVQGSRRFANSAEQNYQQQLAYYKNGVSKIHYKNSDTSSAVWWWCRSPRYIGSSAFCTVDTDGSPTYGNAGVACGFAPLITL